MGFRDFPMHEQGVQLLQRSLIQGRLAHGYLFSGSNLPELEQLAATLAKTLNCLNPLRSPSGVAIDSCDACLNCRKIEHGNHGDLHWVRPESKTRVILIEQVRDLIQTLNLKPAEAEYKVAVVTAADRLRVEAANAFLKTLEEPPAKSILILLTTDSQRILDTILSRCLRLSFGGEGRFTPTPAQVAWLQTVAAKAASSHKSLLGRYLILDQLLIKLSAIRKEVEDALEARSPLSQHEDPEPELREKWESELKAAVEAEYRRLRTDLLLVFQFWLRDIWLTVLSSQNAGIEKGGPPLESMLSFPDLEETKSVAQRIAPREAVENLRRMEDLHRLLHTNVQEALALEVGLLKLKL